MTTANIAIVLDIYSAFEERNFHVLWNSFSKDVEIVQSPELPWGGHYRGLEEVKLFFHKISLYLDNHITVERTIDGADRVAVIGKTYGVARETSCAYEIPVVHIWAIRDRLITRLEVVVDVEAMQAVLQAGSHIVHREL